MVVLEHEPDVLVPQPSTRRGIERTDAVAGQTVVAGPLVILKAEQMQQCRLAGAGGAHDRDELALGDIECDATQHMELTGAMVERLLDAGEPHERPRAAGHRGRRRCR